MCVFRLGISPHDESIGHHQVLNVGEVPSLGHLFTDQIFIALRDYFAALKGQRTMHTSSCGLDIQQGASRVHVLSF